MYTVTTQNANNTDLEVDIMSLTVLANEFQDGEILEFDFVTASKQNSGSSTTLNYKIKVAGQEITLTAAGTQNVSSGNIEGRVPRHYRLKRSGNDLLVSAGTQTGYTGLVGGITTRTQFFSGVDFTQDIDIAISAQWGVAHPDVYLNVLNARANKF